MRTLADAGPRCRGGGKSIASKLCPFASPGGRIARRVQSDASGSSSAAWKQKCAPQSFCRQAVSYNGSPQEVVDHIPEYMFLLDLFKRGAEARSLYEVRMLTWLAWQALRWKDEVE